MAVLEWVRFLAGAVLMLCGLGIFVIEMIGVFRFKYILNRMHAATDGERQGLSITLTGRRVLSGWNCVSVVRFSGVLAFDFASGSDDG